MEVSLSGGLGIYKMARVDVYFFGDPTVGVFSFLLLCFEPFIGFFKVIIILIGLSDNSLPPQQGLFMGSLQYLLQYSRVENRSQPQTG